MAYAVIQDLPSTKSFQWIPGQEQQFYVQIEPMGDDVELSCLALDRATLQRLQWDAQQVGSNAGYAQFTIPAIGARQLGFSYQLLRRENQNSPWTVAATGLILPFKTVMTSALSA